MKAAQLQAPHKMSVVELPSPPLHAGEVRLRIASVGVCGSDMGIIRGENPFANYPLVPGHELSGTVTEVGEGVTDFAPGQRVFVRPITTCGHCEACQAEEWNHCAELKVVGVHFDGAYAEEIVLPQETIRHLPDELSFDDGAMIEPTAVAVHSVNRGGVKKGDKVAIFGSGVIGMLIQQVALHKGASAVFAIDTVDERLALAKQLGAAATANALRDDVVQVGLEKVGPFDVIYDLVGTTKIAEKAVQMAKRGGTIVLLVPQNIPALEVPGYSMLFGKELTVRISRLYDKDFDQAVGLIQSGAVKVEPLITHRFALADVEKALDTVVNKKENLIKAILHC